MNHIEITNDRNEMAQIGKKIVFEKPEVYTPLMLSKLRERISKEQIVLGGGEV